MVGAGGTVTTSVATLGALMSQAARLITTTATLHSALNRFDNLHNKVNLFPF